MVQKKRKQTNEPLKKELQPKTENQALLIDSIENGDITICTGPAGTGKTYISVGMGVKLFNEGRIEKIILCRPAVEAGRQIGFLPGSQEEKLAPYLRPLFDELKNFMNITTIAQLQHEEIIEVAPLEFMRGRTMKNAFVILDEAQNATKEQLKMFVTRIGEGSRFVINGDLDQSDLPHNQKDNLRILVERLGFLEEVRIVKMGRGDIVRHPIIERLLRQLSEYH